MHFEKLYFFNIFWILLFTVFSMFPKVSPGNSRWCAIHHVCTLTVRTSSAVTSAGSASAVHFSGGTLTLSKLVEKSFSRGTLFSRYNGLWSFCINWKCRQEMNHTKGTGPWSKKNHEKKKIIQFIDVIDASSSRCMVDRSRNNHVADNCRTDAQQQLILIHSELS